MTRTPTMVYARAIQIGMECKPFYSSKEVVELLALKGTDRSNLMAVQRLKDAGKLPFTTQSDKEHGPAMFYATGLENFINPSEFPVDNDAA